jgi:diguanylate cyclase (GGDEF)-like protein
MVTVTVPMYKDDEFYGVATIDLKLEGLHNFLERISKSFGGYAFAVDRNGKFLSFPDERLTKRYGIDEYGGRTEEFIDVSELPEIRADFQPLATAVQDAIDRVVTDAVEAGTFDSNLANTISQSSYQVGDGEARLISAVLAAIQASDTGKGAQLHQLFLEDDFLLGESAFAAVFEMPHTYWKIVTVMPHSKAIETSEVIYRTLVSAITVAMLLSLLAMLFLVRHILVKPISTMSKQLQKLSASEGSETGQLEIADKGELGELAFWFNKRSRKLLEVQRELQDTQEALEKRVAERTNELREEIEKRKQEQEIKDAQGARVEKQHAAIIGLALQESLLTEDIAKAARIITETAAQVMGVARCSIWLIDDNDNLKCVDLYQSKTGVHESELIIELNECPIYYEALQNGRSLAVSDMFSDQRTAELKEYATATGVSALLDSPLRVGGKLRGVVCMEHIGEHRQWHGDEIRFSGEIADRFIQVLGNAERIKSEDRIRQLAFYDPLTALANRRLFQETVQHELSVARRHHVFGSLLYLDLDNFKTLNDSLGHAIGDELLIQLARRLQSTLRNEDLASRLGGDEFVVLINGENGNRDEAMEQALNVARKLQKVISEPYRLQGYEHIITCSMGITIYPETDGVASDILKQADTAMYRAKADGRNRICFYNTEMQEAADHRLRLEKELRNAIINREFEMYFQPQVDCKGHHIGAEALVRWIHPEKGVVVPPLNFIPIAEETGLILEIGTWILKDACEFASQCGIRHIAVNISPLQFRQADFVDSVTRTLANAQVDPGIEDECPEGAWDTRGNR